MIKKGLIALSLVGCFALATVFSVNSSEAQVLTHANDESTCNASADCWKNVQTGPNTWQYLKVGSVSCSAASEESVSCSSGWGYVTCNGVTSQCTN